MNIQESAATFAEMLYQQRSEQFELTHREYEQWLTLVGHLCRDKARKIEDPVFRRFMEQAGHFKPSQMELAQEHQHKMLSDPEVVKQIHDMEELVHQHDDEIDLKELNDD